MGLKSGLWKIGEIPVARLFGKDQSTQISTPLFLPHEEETPWQEKTQTKTTNYQVQVR